MIQHDDHMSYKDAHPNYAIELMQESFEVYDKLDTGSMNDDMLQARASSLSRVMWCYDVLRKNCSPMELHSYVTGYAKQNDLQFADVMDMLERSAYVYKSINEADQWG